MYINNKILIGKNETEEVYLLPKMANRHGIISGASGSGKTITLKVLAESFSDASVPVFLVDVKGDLAGTSKKGELNENIEKRVSKLNLEGFTLKNYPTNFWDVYGVNGHPIRTTVSSVGSRLLSRMLNLSETQESVLSIIFKIAEDENLELVDLKDLRSLITYVGDKRKEYTLNYGNISIQTLGAIGRNLLQLEEDGGNLFFGKPSFDIKDFMKYSSTDGRGFINILDAVELFKNPTLYSTFLLWLLNNIYDTLEEVGDLEKPKLVFFFDEAHLLFSEMPDHIIKKITSIVKLIRSKGVGLYFISQSPSDIPDEILSQLGNRIQHVLRYYTKSDEKAIKVAADSFRINKNFDIKEAITELKTGEALVSVQDSEGSPTITERVFILPPQSLMGSITYEERQEIIKNGMFYQKYEKVVDDKSAFEKINKLKEEQIDEIKEEKNEEHSVLKKDTEKVAIKKETKKQPKKKKSALEKATTKVTNRVLSTIGTKIGNAVWKAFKK